MEANAASGLGLTGFECALEGMSHLMCQCLAALHICSPKTARHFLLENLPECLHGCLLFSLVYGVDSRSGVQVVDRGIVPGEMLDSIDGNMKSSSNPVYMSTRRDNVPTTPSGNLGVGNAQLARDFSLSYIPSSHACTKPCSERFRGTFHILIHALIVTRMQERLHM